MRINLALFPFPFSYKPKANPNHCHFTSFINFDLKILQYVTIWLRAIFYVKSQYVVLDSVIYLFFCMRKLRMVPEKNLSLVGLIVLIKVS